ncbi:biotin--[acetyl-CoA-carboxylase] ligase [Streptacidiphilus fuscans]|uniref:biotin--[biotin carboxyl-carrier protein] ligase n=1 Tax=Streptacidiphilus fuscans TaxID=2789292 RepID=A0A931B8W2_9ACTN|nr:biotin--[acetyl-CoA-carboxylase] ligase [Streptacidiphilus fuscans]MBF9073259.1 biotin--[acetyl-CoA-carboxylase] ligase [Streptacidiphilus fuscans]
MTESPWNDLDRPPLRAAQLNRDPGRLGALWNSLVVVAETGSTNVDLAEIAARGTPEGAVLVAEQQTHGKGRLDRRWSAPARSGIFLSMLLRPGDAGVPRDNWSWLPLLVGVAASSALSRAAQCEVRLKWPNDLLVPVGPAGHREERKTGGILVELADEGRAVIAGMGVNVTLREDELPVPTAASLALAGAQVTDREILLRELLRTFSELYEEWCADGGDPSATRLRDAYLDQCATIGKHVRVLLPGDKQIVGEAVDVDDLGRLVIREPSGAEHAVSAGDVIHVRGA